MKYSIFFFSLLFLFASCKKEESKQTNIATHVSHTGEISEPQNFEHPKWAANATMYEVNTRQFSEEGTFAKIEEDLPRLKNMGIDILWLMPIHPISEKRRKASDGSWVEEIDDIEERKKYLGSHYAAADYKKVNPFYGTMADFKSLVDAAHAKDMKIIIDWVPNHTGWDHPWIEAHPDWYTQNEDGEIIDPIDPGTGKSWGWTDVADLNYNNEEMRQEMINDMQFWLTEANIDGFRVDVAHGVPVDFWRAANSKLRTTKQDIFMLAEAEVPALGEMYSASYAWSFHHLLKETLDGEKDFSKLTAKVQEYDDKFGEDHMMLMFTTNHDENSWNGTVFERYGDAHKAMAVLSFTLDGMPLMYNGQEAAMDKRLKFFEKDAIDWKDYPLQDFYAELLALKKANKALYNGKFGGSLKAIDSGNKEIYLYQRSKGDNTVTVAINFSNKDQFFDWPFEKDGSYKLEMGTILPDDSGMGLGPNGYAVWVK